MAPANEDEHPEAEAGCLSGLRILVVEDSWHVATAVQSLLRSFGADVDGPVASAVEAERLVAERIPDVAIVDINLRGGELAYDLIDKLRVLRSASWLCRAIPRCACTRTRSPRCCTSRSPKPTSSRLCSGRKSRRSRRARQLIQMLGGSASFGCRPNLGLYEGIE